MAHLCHANGCSAPVPPRRLMCLRHWRLVPVALQKAVWGEYVTGQEVRKDPTPAYLAAAKAAVLAVETSSGNFSKGSISEAIDNCVLVRASDGTVADPLFNTPPSEE